MKIFKEHPIFMVCLVMFIFAMSLVVNSDHVKSLSSYKETSQVLINDGNQGEESYYVHLSTVENALNDLDIVLNEEDSLNYELTYELQKDDVIEITRVTYAQERTSVAVAYATEYVMIEDSTLVGNRLIQEGVDGTKDIIYNVRKVNGVEVSREERGSEITVDPIHKTYEVSATTTGRIFTGKLTSYGADCVGCGTRTAAGLYVTVNGVKNERTATLSFNGGEYYVLAADKEFPFGTIVKISNHSYNIPDPFYGIVLDRGGAVTGTHMDLYTGSQVNPLFGGHGGTVTYEIIAYGDGRTSIY